MLTSSPTGPRLSATNEKSEIDRHQDRDCDQKTDQQFGGGAVVFEGLAGDLGVRPQETPHVGREPEPVDAERHREQQRAAQQQPPECAGIADEADRPGVGWRGGGGGAHA